MSYVSPSHDIFSSVAKQLHQIGSYVIKDDFLLMKT